MKRLKPILQSKKFYLILTILTFSYLILMTKIIRYESIYNPNDKEFIGIIYSIKKTDYGYSLTLKAKEKLIVYLEDNNYNLGDLVYIKGDLEKPKNNTVLNNFNYKEYLYHNKIFYILNAKEIKVLKENENIIYKLKNNLLKYLDTFKSNNYLKSFILADTSYLDNEIYNSYQINGICHLLSIGSTHITFLSIFLLYIFKKLKFKEVISYLIMFIIIFIYLLLTDFQVAILRVYLYMILSFLNKKLKFDLKPINIFLLVISLTLFLNPFYIYHRGFLYSYSISFILILNKDNLTGNYFKKILKISLISFLYSIPFNIYFNYSLNLFSVLYNLIYVPSFNLVVFPLSLLTVIFPFLDNIFYLVVKNLNNLSFILNKIDIGIIILRKISIIVLIIYLGIFAYLIKELSRKKFKTLIIIFIILLLHVHINDFIKENFFMIIDVNQGDSSLFYSNNKTILIDTGGLYKKNNVVKTITMLQSLGISKIDYLFLTHGDYDHMGDSLYLVSHFKVLNVVFNSNTFNALESDLLELLKEKKINYSIGYQGMTYKFNNIKIFLFNKSYDNENDSSLIMYILFNDKKILMMGDASTKVENELLKKYNISDIDFFKVGHHGSNTSSSEYFINSIKPKYAFISVGKNNLYGHPKKETLDNLSKSRIYRTDKDGSILIKFKDNNYLIKNYAP